ncbi:DNA fragmentation factor subunit alpha [Phyllostomus discolor]|uniref:DNAation factor subunit alpha n=1 Tax=Phyllostomus discolor TaxID=89673 RepID=A0A834EBH2_9CHIR|nr:DNA fragmentation factor subunit alpha [Phyllostomus discolor]
MSPIPPRHTHDSTPTRCLKCRRVPGQCTKDTPGLPDLCAVFWARCVYRVSPTRGCRAGPSLAVPDGAAGELTPVLIDVPSSDLARELGHSRVAVQGLQNTLQQVLDQREEARQSKQLLELYLQALEKEGSILSKQQEPEAGFSDQRDAVDAGVSTAGSSETALPSQILAALKEKPAPELSLSSQDLELVAKEDPRALAAALNWDTEKTEAVQQACQQELSLRLQQVQSLRSLRSVSAGRGSLPEKPQAPKRARVDPS